MEDERRKEELKAKLRRDPEYRRLVIRSFKRAGCSDAQILEALRAYRQGAA